MAFQILHTRVNTGSCRFYFCKIVLIIFSYINSMSSCVLTDAQLVICALRCLQCFCAVKLSGVDVTFT